MKRTAILIGATGLTGNYLLQNLLESDTYRAVKVFARSQPTVTHEKLEWYTADLLKLTDYSEDFNGDVVFCCIGTTKSKTKNKTKYEKIDVGIPHNAAKLAKNNHIPTFIVISALGAKLKSRVFYNRIKGKMEQKVLEQGVERTYILRPSIIKGKREEKRIMERVLNWFMELLKPLMIGDLTKYQPISFKDIVKCMLYLDQNSYNKSIIESDKIGELAEMYD